MMHLSILGSLLAFLAQQVRADSNAEAIEFQAILSDVNGHLNDYISLAMNNPSFTIPSGVLDVYTQMTTYTDDSYTTLFSELDMTAINSALSQLPWYSSRLQPEIQSAFEANSITDTSMAAKTTDSSSSSSVEQTTSTASTVTSTDSSSKETKETSQSSSKESASQSQGSSSTTSTSSANAADNLVNLSPILGAAIAGSVAMLL